MTDERFPSPDPASYWERKARPVKVLEGDAALAVFNAGASRFLAALNAMRALAADWAETATKLEAVADRACESGNAARSTLLSGRAQAHRDCSQALREYLADADQGWPQDAVTSRCECGGLARHVADCRWRQGYGSRVVSPAETKTQED